MSADRSPLASVRRSVIEPTVRRWLALDTDWQSVVCAVGIVALVVGVDIPGSK